MIQNQLGTTLTIEYPVYVEGYDTLEGLDLTLYVECNRFKKEMDITVESNTITFTFQGKDQRVAGIYDIILVLNEGLADQVILTNKNVFNLYR